MPLPHSGDRSSLDTGATPSTATHGRTLLELTQQADGTWTATQVDVHVEGSGETAALAAMDYCRRIAEGAHGDD